MFVEHALLATTVCPTGGVENMLESLVKVGGLQQTSEEYWTRKARCCEAVPRGH